jgi:mannose-1-phosphate guanylyltransferase
MKNLFPVILSGGSGDRLWPKSRKNLPKQFIDFNKIGNLFTHTLKRVKILNNCQNLIIASSRDYEYLIKRNLKNFPENPNLILEEISKNTSPAIYFAALSALEKSKDAILCIMPSDHWIEDAKNFKLIIQKGISEAEKGFWVTLGIKPTNPATGFGYIKTGNHTHKEILDVLEFVEKPSLSTAQGFLQDKNYFWNAGIFLVSAYKIKESFLKVNPILEKSIFDAWLKREILDGINIIKKREMTALQNISIDKAILEKEKSIKLIQFNSYWSDFQF